MGLYDNDIYEEDDKKKNPYSIWSEPSQLTLQKAPEVFHRYTNRAQQDSLINASYSDIDPTDPGWKDYMGLLEYRNKQREESPFKEFAIGLYDKVATSLGGSPMENLTPEQEEIKRKKKASDKRLFDN